MKHGKGCMDVILSLVRLYHLRSQTLQPRKLLFKSSLAMLDCVLGNSAFFLESGFLCGTLVEQTVK